MSEHADDRIRRQVSNYRLVSLLGRGAFGTVYLGEHIYLHTKAAVKILRPPPTSDYLEIFQIEARVTASLVHPNIVRVLDYGVEDGTPFLVLEYAPYGTLSSYHRKGEPLSTVTILPYIKQVASALQYAHSQGVVHGQVTPANLLLGNNNQVLITNFDYRLASNLNPDNREFQLLGTPLYIAPEQVMGHQLMPASDQYALGVVVYEWLSGTRPFEGDSTVSLALKHLHEQPPSLRIRVPTISLALEQVVMRALAKDPTQRFPSIQAFADAFEQAYQSQHYPYDVALSFAGQDRSYAHALAEVLRGRGLNVFYDTYEKSTLWGKNLYTYLSDIYQNKARYCVMFLSQYYAEKLWTNHEREAAQARAFEENEEYILPVRLDDTKIPGISSTVAYLSWPPETAETIADAIMQKLQRSASKHGRTPLRDQGSTI